MADTQEIKDKLDIVDFISEYIQLKPAGVNHKGCCPFHREKTPSFMVNRERQSWHCFGCSKGGDIFSFLQEIEGIDFVEALKFLADKAGVQLEYRASDVNTSQRNRVKDVNTQAASFFHNFLLKMSASRPALNYINERGLNRDTIEKWQIGFIPDQWDLLTKYLLQKGFSVDDLVASGLTIKRDGAHSTGSGQAGTNSQRGFYDRFRGRIMFPICDVHGSVVGFTGRVLVENEKSGGKYVNTPQTIVYDKSRVVFGLDKSKQEIKTKDLIVMVEGQMDVIACHQAGMKNVVASSGTALTDNQVKLLKRYSKNMNMAFDSDDAGQAAAERGIDVAIKEGIAVKVIIIPEGKGKDPDECLKMNKEVWFESVENAKDIMKWRLNKAFLGKDLSNPRHKQLIADEVLSKIILIPYAVERDHWLRELGSKLDVDVSVLRENMKQISENTKKRITEDSNAENTPTVDKNIDFQEMSKIDVLLERFLMLIFRFDSLYNHINGLNKAYLVGLKYLPIYECIKNQYNTDNLIDIEKLRDKFASDDFDNPIDLLLMKGELEFTDFSKSDSENEIKQLIEQIKINWIKDRRKDIQKEIEKAEKENDKDKLKYLFEEFQKLTI
jgi:DNA primase